MDIAQLYRLTHLRPARQNDLIGLARGKGDCDGIGVDASWRD